VQDVAREILSIIDRRIRSLFSGLLKTNLLLEDHAIVASVSPLTVYINDSNVAVPCNNPRGLTLSVGNNVWVKYPNGNQSLKYVDRGVSSKFVMDTNATSAINLANNAQADATTTLSILSDIANRDKVTGEEKVKILKPRLDLIVSEKVVNIDVRVTLYSSIPVTSAYDSYVVAYNNLNNYLAPSLTDLTQTSSIIRNDLNTAFISFYDSRAALINALEYAEKDYFSTEISELTAIANDALTNSYTAISTANSAVTTSNTYTDDQVVLLKTWVDLNYVHK